MAHPNIEERRAHVRRLVAENQVIRGALRQELSRMYDCASAAIYADTLLFTRPATADVFHAGKTIRKKIHTRDGDECQYCGSMNAEGNIIEHVIPTIKGGVGKPHNLVVACQKCNTTKRSAVWTPRNLDAITADHPEWRERIIRESSGPPQQAAPLSVGKWADLKGGTEQR